MADLSNVAEVALEAGNSPDIIFQHYRELVTGEAAKQWFGTTPAVIAAESKQLKEEAAKLWGEKGGGGRIKAKKKGVRRGGSERVARSVAGRVTPV